MTAQKRRFLFIRAHNGLDRPIRGHQTKKCFFIAQSDPDGPIMGMKEEELA
jgi:hypothetical protein